MRKKYQRRKLMASDTPLALKDKSNHEYIVVENWFHVIVYPYQNRCVVVRPLQSEWKGDDSDFVLCESIDTVLIAMRQGFGRNVDTNAALKKAVKQIEQVLKNYR